MTLPSMFEPYEIRKNTVYLLPARERVKGECCSNCESCRCYQCEPHVRARILIDRMKDKYYPTMSVRVV